MDPNQEEEMMAILQLKVTAIIQRDRKIIQSEDIGCLGFRSIVSNCTGGDQPLDHILGPADGPG